MGKENQEIINDEQQVDKEKRLAGNVVSNNDEEKVSTNEEALIDDVEQPEEEIDELSRYKKLRSMYKSFLGDTDFYIDRTVSYDLIEENREKYLIDIDGKDFVVFKGLLDIAHTFGLKSIETKIIKLDAKEKQCIVEAIVEYQDGTTFTGHGHADPSNLDPKLVPSYIAMAETRAIARALRFGNNVGLTSSDELPEKSAASLMGDNASTFTKVSNSTANKILSYLDNDEKYEKIIQVIQKQFGVNSILELSEKEAETILKFLENTKTSQRK